MSAKETTPHDRRRRRIATAIAVAFHAILAIIYGPFLASLFAHPKHEVAQTTEIVTIARRTPAPSPTPTPAPVPKPLAPAAPPPPLATEPPPPPVAPVHPEIAPPHEESVPRPVRKTTITHRAPAVVAPIATAPPVVAHGTHVTPKVPGKARLTSSQIASIQNDLANSIARDKAADDPTKIDAPDAVATMKDYGASYSGFDDIGDARRGHGLCDPMSSWEQGGYDYYYVACEVHLSDGGQERQIVPWPVRFPPNDNPFTGTARGNVPLSMPLPGWHKDATTVISAELRQYAKDNGVDL